MSVEFFPTARTPACAAVLVPPVSAEASHCACPRLGRTCPHPGSPRDAKASSSASVKKQEPLREGERRSAGHSHSVLPKGEENGKKDKLLCFYTLVRMTGTGTQHCQLFASPWIFLMKEHFGKPSKISMDHTDIDSLCKEPQEPGNGHSPRATRAQRGFGQCSQTQSKITRISVQGQELRFHDLFQLRTFYGPMNPSSITVFVLPCVQQLATEFLSKQGPRHWFSISTVLLLCSGLTGLPFAFTAHDTALNQHQAMWDWLQNSL